MKRGRVATTVALLLLVAGCGLQPKVEGVWRTPDDVVVAWPTLEFAGRMELVLGQYGESVAGMLRLYEADEEFKENYLFSACPCMYLDQASFDSGTLVFDVSPCGDEGEGWSGRFEWSEGDSVEFLTGSLTPKGLEGGPAPIEDITFQFSGGNKLIKEHELNQECLAPTQ